MAAYVLELFGDRNRAAEMGRAGREHVLARWTVDRMVRGYEELIAERLRGEIHPRPAGKSQSRGKARGTEEIAAKRHSFPRQSPPSPVFDGHDLASLLPRPAWT